MNWVDLLALAVTAAVVVLQMFRMKLSFSMIVYETPFILAAGFAADKLLPRLRESAGLAEPLAYVGTFVILGGLGIVIATLINRVFEFEAGRSRYVFGFLLTLVTGVVVAHVLVKEVVIAAGPRNAAVGEAVARSAVGVQLVHGKFVSRLIPGLIHVE
jgi:hypothetical protein